MASASQYYKSSPVGLDLGDDDNFESAKLREIAIINDPNGVYTMPSADKLLIDLGQLDSGGGGGVVGEEEYLEIINDIAEARFAAGASQEDYDDIFYDVFVNQDKAASLSGLTTSRQVLKVSFGLILTVGTQDNFVAEYDDNGNQTWSASDPTSAIRALDVDSNGNAYSMDYAGKVAKFDSTGAKQWDTTPENNSSDDKALRVDPVNSELYTMAGTTTVYKLDSLGNTLWTNTDHRKDIDDAAVDDNGNVYVTGGDSVITKIAPDGSEVWRSNLSTAWLTGVGVSRDGQVVYGGSDQGEIVKLDSAGNELWKKTAFGTENVLDIDVDSAYNSYCVHQGGNVVKTDKDQNQQWQVPSGFTAFNAVSVDSTEDFVYAGRADGSLYKFYVSDGAQKWSAGSFSEINALGIRNVPNSSGTYTSIVKNLAFTPSKVYLDSVKNNVKTGGSITITVMDNSGNSQTITDGDNSLSFADGDVTVEVTISTNDDNTIPELDEYGLYWV